MVVVKFAHFRVMDHAVLRDVTPRRFLYRSTTSIECESRKRQATSQTRRIVLWVSDLTVTAYGGCTRSRIHKES